MIKDRHREHVPLPLTVCSVGETISWDFPGSWAWEEETGGPAASQSGSLYPKGISYNADQVGLAMSQSQTTMGQWWKALGLLSHSMPFVFYSF